MPGTILVTVLELMEVQLPSTSISSSPEKANMVLVKVSHGKREYITKPHHAEGNKRGIVWESSDFSFQVLSLRDNLTVSVLDCDENEIGRADIRSHSIVEKGLWDDMFPLTGGGLVHLKLQFVLSDAERQRIQAMRAAALKKKEEGPLKESLPEVGVEKVPTVDYKTFPSTPGVISSPEKFVLECLKSPSPPSDQSLSSTTPPLSFDVKSCEDSISGYLSKHEEPYGVVPMMDKPQLSKPEVTSKGNLRKVKEMIQAFESSTTMEPKRAKLSRSETNFQMSEADSHAQYSWKVESSTWESSMIQKDSNALHNVDVPKHYTTDENSKFRNDTGNEDTKFLMVKALRNGGEEDCFQDFVEVEDGDGKSNQEPSEKKRAKLTKTFSFIEASSVLQNRLKEEGSFTRSKSAREFKVDAQVNVAGGCSAENLLPFDVLLQEKVPLRSTATHAAETEDSNREPLPAKILEIESLISGNPQPTINESESYKGDAPLQSTDTCDAKSIGAKVVLQNGEDIHQFTVDDETGQVAHLDLCSHQCINAQKIESGGMLPLYWFSNKFQESLAMHPQMEHTIFESLTDYITCGEMRYLCLTAGNERAKHLEEIYMTLGKCTLQKKSGRLQAAEKGFIENIKDSSCQKKSGPDNLMGALDLLDGFLKQTVRVAMIVACGALFFNIGRKTR